MSKIVAILPCRNSAWVLGLSARALLMWVDELHILCHACTDDTREIVFELEIEYPRRVYGLCIDSGIWQEMAHRQLLLESARASNATHVVIIDDDEVVSGNLLPKIRGWVESTPPFAILQLPWLQLRGSIDSVISTGMWAHQSASVAFLDQPALHWKALNGYDHHHRHPMGACLATMPVLSAGNRTGGLMHLQMASEERLLWKHLWYKLTERSRWPEKPIEAIEAMYNRTVSEYGNCVTHPVPDGWWAPYADLMQYLHIGEEPWQKAEALRMLAENPRLADGLLTYGLEL